MRHPSSSLKYRMRHAKHAPDITLIHSWKIPKMWKGGTCIIIGGGPSMPRQFGVPESIIQKVQEKKLSPKVYSDYMTSIHDQHVIGVNMAYILGDWIDVLFFGDRAFYLKEKQGIDKFKGLRVTSNVETGNAEGPIKLVQKHPRVVHGVSFIPEYVCWNGCSGGAAINLAIHFGVKRIILLGFDMYIEDAKHQHWHKAYPMVGANDVDNIEYKPHAFPRIAKRLKGKIEVINASPESAIPSFPKMAFKDIKL